MVGGHIMDSIRYMDLGADAFIRRGSGVAVGFFGGTARRFGGGGVFFAAVVAVVLLVAVSAFGASVRFETAENVARKHLEKRRGGGKIRRDGAYAANAFTPYHVFEKEGGGFIIVSADDAAAPILGETDSGVFDRDSIPPALAWLLGTYAGQIEAAAKKGGAPDSGTKRLWEESLQSHGLAKVASSSYPLKLLSTTWDQRTPYDRKTPLDNGKRSATGCVAVNMAQIMKYRQYPSSGIGASKEYYTKTNHTYIPPLNFNIAYDYANMLDSYSSADDGTEEQRDAVATLMYHCGVSVKMDYAAKESGAFDSDAAAALVKYFGYDNSVRYYKSDLGFSANDWKDIIIGQIENNSPVYYSGYDTTGGHVFIIDGYDDGADKFHINWGWGGSCDGYFALTALNPDSVSLYNFRHGMIINIMPNTNGKPPSQVKLNGFEVSLAQTTLMVKVAAKVSYGVEFAGKIGFAVMSGGAVGMVLDSADCMIFNTSNTIYGGIALYRQLSADMPYGDLELRVVIKRGGSAWVPLGEPRTVSVPKAYEVKFNANGGGVFIASGVTGVGGKLAFLPLPTRFGHAFVGWFTEASGGTEVTAATEYGANATIYAQWKPASIVTFNAEGGVVTPEAATTSIDGKLMFLPLPAKTGYTFVGWFTAEEGGAEVTANTSFPANAAVYARWTPKTPSAVLDPNSGSGSGASHKGGGAAVVSPVPALTAEFSAAPNPARKSFGVVNFFHTGGRVASATLYVYDALGNAVGKVDTAVNTPENAGKRVVGSWDMTDRKGRAVPDGTYLVRGVIKASTGKPERVSAVVRVGR